MFLTRCFIRDWKRKRKDNCISVNRRLEVNQTLIPNLYNSKVSNRAARGTRWMTTRIQITDTRTNIGGNKFSDGQLRNSYDPMHNIHSVHIRNRESVKTASIIRILGKLTRWRGSLHPLVYMQKCIIALFYNRLPRNSTFQKFPNAISNIFSWNLKWDIFRLWGDNLMIKLL